LGGGNQRQLLQLNLTSFLDLQLVRCLLKPLSIPDACHVALCVMDGQRLLPFLLFPPVFLCLVSAVIWPIRSVGSGKRVSAFLSFKYLLLPF
jgi:hypothetical protein